MALVLVEHEAEEPALYGMTAALVARARRAGVAHLPARFDTTRHADAVQHVTRDGHLVPSGLVWIERICAVPVGEASDPRQIVADCGHRDVVVPHHPALAEGGSFEALVAHARDEGIAVERVSVAAEGRGFRLSGAGIDAVWSRDGYGRPRRATAPGAATVHAPETINIALAGSPRDHRDVYPAVLAALGDAADELGVAASVRFIAPSAFSGEPGEAFLAGIDGVVLPGGSAMANVAGQVEAAAAAIAGRIPILGLCLGMQTMVTAVVRSRSGLEGANLAEADPSAPLKTFVPISIEGCSPVHRLGEVAISVEAGSALATLLGPRPRIRVNHRFRLDPPLIPLLCAAGLKVTAFGETSGIADGVELDGHPFGIGTQGHPELGSRPGAPHPLFTGFLRASRAHSRRHRDGPSSTPRGRPAAGSTRGPSSAPAT